MLILHLRYIGNKLAFFLPFISSSTKKNKTKNKGFPLHPSLPSSFSVNTALSTLAH